MLDRAEGLLNHDVDDLVVHHVVLGAHLMTLDLHDAPMPSRPLGRDMVGQCSATAFQQEVDEYVTEIVDAKFAQGVIRNR